MNEPTTAAEVEAYALRKQLKEERTFKGELRQDNHNLSVLLAEKRCDLAAARLDISSLKAALDSSYKTLSKNEDEITGLKLELDGTRGVLLDARGNLEIANHAIHAMRSCENCTEGYCQDGADHEKGEECYENDKSHWEHMV